MVVLPPPLRAGRVGVLHHPCPAGAQATVLERNSALGIAGSSVLCCFLLDFLELLGEPGERTRPREGTGSPRHTQQAAGFQLGAPPPSCHLHLEIKAEGATRPQQDFPNASGSTRHSESYPFFGLLW